MKKKPFISILIPTYNREKDLDFALFCILRQNFHDFEIIISDNCSRDGTEDIVKKYKDKRIRYFRNKKNLSYLSNVKKTLEHANGQYFFFHADDDFLLHENALSEISKKIIKYKPGYIRINYLCLTPDKKNIFNFNWGKPLTKDKLIAKNLSNNNIIKFIFDTDATFTSGIIFKNNWPESVGVINTGLMPWIDILLFNIKKYGGCFISKPYIIASWSQWVMRENEPHHLYSLQNGKLVYETQYNFIKSKLTEEEYKVFLRNRLMISFVSFLPAIKVYVGNQEMQKLVKRMKLLDPKIDKSLTYRIYYLGASFVPRLILKIIKEYYFKLYTRSLKVKDQKIFIEFQKLSQEYDNQRVL